MSENQISLVRGLGLVAAISMIIGNVIGTGVFLKARVMTCNLGSPEWVILAWVAAGILSLAGALTYAELSAMKPEAGGEYVFLRDAYGKLTGFLFGWMQILVAKTGSQAAVAVAFAIGLNDFLKSNPADKVGPLGTVLYSTGGDEPFYTLTVLQLIAVALIAIFTIINFGSVVLAGRIATVLTFVKIGLILFVGLGAFLWVTGGNFGHFSMMSTGGTCEGVDEAVKFGSPTYSFVAGFAAAMLGALWGYDGWNNLAHVAGEVKKPQKNIPLALIGGTVGIIILYVGVHIAYFYILDPTTVASVSKNSSVAKEVVARFFGADITTFATGFAISLFTVGLMLSSIGTLHTSIVSGGRFPYALAKDGVMFGKFAEVSPKTKSPIYAILVQGIWASILALSGSFDALTDYVVFGSWIFYALATSTVFVFRRRYPNAERPYKAFGYPVVPVLFLLVAGWLLFTTIINAPQQSLIGIFLILLGLPIYYYLVGKQRVTTAE